jgi:hypothetical protein
MARTLLTLQSAFEGLQGRPFKRHVQQWIAVSGLAMLLALGVVVLASDLARLIA